MGTSWVGVETPIPEDEQTVWLGVSYGFWADDWTLHIWQTMMGEVVDAEPDAPEWLRAIRHVWRESPDGGGCVFIGFTDRLPDTEQREALLQLVLQALQRLLEFGGDYRRAFPSTKLLENESETAPAISLAQKVGLIEVSASIARVLTGAIGSGEHWPRRGVGPGFR